MKRRFATALAAALLLGGCDRPQERPLTPEILNERRVAYRQACAAREIANRSVEDIATLEEVLTTTDPSQPLAEINQIASAAALQFARAYNAHAELRHAVYAHLDSAVNQAATRADSARYVEQAGAFTVRSPQPGSVEENVFRSYQTNFVTLLQNPDHPCNWDLPF